MTDLVVRGGTVVTAGGSRVADVAVDGGRITAVEPDLGGPAATAREVVDATGLLVLPGVVDVHTHTRVASDARAGPVLRRLRRGGVRRHDDVPLVQQPRAPARRRRPRGRSSPGLREWRAATDGDAAVDVGASASWSRPPRTDPVAELPGGDRGRRADASRRSWSTTSAWTTPRCSGRSPRPARTAACSRSTARTGRSSRRSPRATSRPGEVAPRFHATLAPAVRRGRGDGARDRARPGRRRAAVRRPPLLGRGAGRGARGARGRRPARVRRDLPPLPGPDRRALRRAARGGRPVRHLAAAARARQSRRAVGRPRATASLALVATDHVPDRVAVEKQSWRESFDRISNGGPGIETLLAVVYDEGVAAGRITVERLVDVLSTTPARLFGLRAEGGDRGRARRGPRAVRPGRAPDDPRRGPPPLERLHAVRGPRGPRRGPLDDRPRLVRGPRRRVRRAPRASAGSWSASSSRCAEAPGRQASRRYASRVRNSANSSSRTRPSSSAAASASRPGRRSARPIRASSSSRIAPVALRRERQRRRRAARAWRRHCHSWEREISAVAASSMRLSIAAAPLPREPGRRGSGWRR